MESPYHRPFIYQPCLGGCLSVCSLASNKRLNPTAQIVCGTIRKCDSGKDYDLTKFDYKNFENQQNIF